MPAQTMKPPVPAASQIHQLQFSRTSAKKLLEGIAKEKHCALPGCCANHALWIAGHLATTDDYFLKEFGASTTLALPESWHKTIFGYKSTPVDDSSKYPSFDEVIKAFDERRNATIKWFETMSADQLQKATPEGWANYAPTIGDLAGFMAWHDGYHCGQLAVVRKGLGMPPAFG